MAFDAKYDMRDFIGGQDEDRRQARTASGPQGWHVRKFSELQLGELFRCPAYGANIKASGDYQKITERYCLNLLAENLGLFDADQEVHTRFELADLPIKASVQARQWDALYAQDQYYEEEARTTWRAAQYKHLEPGTLFRFSIMQDADRFETYQKLDDYHIYSLLQEKVYVVDQLERALKKPLKTIWTRGTINQITQEQVRAMIYEPKPVRRIMA